MVRKQKQTDHEPIKFRKEREEKNKNTREISTQSDRRIARHRNVGKGKRKQFKEFSGFYKMIVMKIRQRNAQSIKI